MDFYIFAFLHFGIVPIDECSTRISTQGRSKAFWDFGILIFVLVSRIDLTLDSLSSLDSFRKLGSRSMTQRVAGSGKIAPDSPRVVMHAEHLKKVARGRQAAQADLFLREPKEKRAEPTGNGCQTTPFCGSEHHVSLPPA